VERHESEQLVHARLDLRLLGAADPHRVPDVAGHRQVREQGERLEDHADVEQVRRPVGDVLVVEVHPALGGPLEPGDHAQHRRLAATGRPEERDQLAGGELEVHPGDRLDVAGA
jgi:hypothetical protein